MGNIDKYWYSDCSMEDVFVKSFNDTARVIMSKPTTVWDAVKVFVFIAGAIVVLLVLLTMMKARNARAKEKAEETEKILKASMESVSSGSYADSDELVDKYKK